MLFALLLAASAWASASGPDMTVLGIGDSTTAGTPGFASPVEAPPDGAGNPQSQYAYWIENAHPEWNVMNRGVNGERTDEILARFEAETQKADVAVILAGVNDLYQGRSADEVKAGLSRLYAEAARRKLAVVACTILPYDSASAAITRRMHEVNDWIREEASRRGFLFCDTRAAVADGDRLAGTPDGLHPDPFRYRKMGEALVVVLEAYYSQGLKSN